MSEQSRNGITHHEHGQGRRIGCHPLEETGLEKIASLRASCELAPKRCEKMVQRVGSFQKRGLRVIRTPLFEDASPKKSPETGNRRHQVSGVRRLFGLDMIENCEPLASHGALAKDPRQVRRCLVQRIASTRAYTFALINWIRCTRSAAIRVESFNCDASRVMGGETMMCAAGGLLG